MHTLENHKIDVVLDEITVILITIGTAKHLLDIV